MTELSAEEKETGREGRSSYLWSYPSGRASPPRHQLRALKASGQAEVRDLYLEAAVSEGVVEEVRRLEVAVADDRTVGVEVPERRAGG